MMESVNRIVKMIGTVQKQDVLLNLVNARYVFLVGQKMQPQDNAKLIV